MLCQILLKLNLFIWTIKPWTMIFQYCNFVMVRLCGETISENISRPAPLWPTTTSVSCCCGRDVFLPCVSLIFHPIPHPEEIGLCKNNWAEELVWNWRINNLPFGHHPSAWPWIMHFLTFLHAKIIFGSINLNSTPHPCKTITDKHRWQLPPASLAPLMYAMYCSAQQLVVQTHGTHHQAPHIYTHTPSNPNPDPATKLLLFHSTQGKCQCTQPFHSKIRISATNSVRAEGEGRQLNMFSCPIWKALHVYTHAHKNSVSLSLSRTYVWYITAKQFTAIRANRGYRGWSLIRVNYNTQVTLIWYFSWSYYCLMTAIRYDRWACFFCPEFACG